MKCRNLIDRLWAKDSTLWSTNPDVQAKIQNRLGWLTSPNQFLSRLSEITKFSAEIIQSGYQAVVLLGMGGSSLAPEVFADIFKTDDGLPLTVLDTTDPSSIAQAQQSLEIDQTLFIVSTKSGSTIETRSLFHYFYQQAKGNGDQFVAITDPGSKLVGLAEECRFKSCFLNPVDIGGRYSVFSYFGLIPASLIGIDLERLLKNAIGLDWQLAVDFGLELARHSLAGRDKMTLVSSPGIDKIGCWVEQLIAESTGKDGKGIIPVDAEPVGVVNDYGADRIFVYLRLDNELDSQVGALKEGGFPVYQHDLADLYDLGQSFLYWELATAIAGTALGINPFDEPNVTESKNCTAEILNDFPTGPKLPEEEYLFDDGGIQIYGTESHPKGSIKKCLSTFLSSAQLGDYTAIMAYTPSFGSFRVADLFERIRGSIRRVYRLATTLGYGPRFLHSTGQLHKGGANNGLFIQVTVDCPEEELPIPEADYDFWTLKMAQAYGDLRALLDKNRRVIRIHISGQDIETKIEKLTEVFEQL